MLEMMQRHIIVFLYYDCC